MHALKLKWACILPGTFTSPKKVHRTMHNIRSLKEYLSSQKRSQIQKRFAQQIPALKLKRVPILPETFANPKKVRTTNPCTEVKKSTYPPRNVRKSKKGSHNKSTALKLKRVPILPETFANPKKVRTTNPCTEVKKSTYPPRNVRKSKKGTHNNCTALKLKKYLSSQKHSQTKKVRTTIALHWSQKEYLSSQKRSQIQKRFAQQLHCTEVKKSTYPPRNVRKSKKGSHNNCTALKSKRVPILPETFANPKKVRTTNALHWS